MSDLISGVLAGNRRAIARMLTQVENQPAGVDGLLTALFPHTGHAWVIGVTGAPGTGKSTLVNALTKAYRERGQQVGIIAVDPTSPFTGGAILGDRIRMRDLSGDDGVFIRSMATRGNLGGLARATRDAVRVLDAGGFQIVIVETVGAGQNEIDIVRAAHTTLVVDAPGMGDDVQAIKAGILEIADVLVVNKADRPGATQTVRALKTMLDLGHPARLSTSVGHHGRMLPVASVPAPNGSDFWLPPILSTVASDGTGIDALIEAISDHRDHLEHAGRLAQMEQAQFAIEIQERLRDHLMQRVLQQVPSDAISSLIAQVQARHLDPQRAVESILEQVGFAG